MNEDGLISSDFTLPASVHGHQVKSSPVEQAWRESD